MKKYCIHVIMYERGWKKEPAIHCEVNQLKARKCQIYSDL